MTLIEKKDLQYDYSWNKPGNNPKSGEKPESTVFDREEGSDVLSVINRYADEHDITDKSRALKMESRIRTEMHDDIGTHKEVYQWLKSAFGKDGNK